VRRIPFTLLLALTILVTTTVTGTLLRAIDAADLVRWGFSAADLAHGRWFHLFLATFQILDPYLALSMLATVLALVGSCEYRLGTARTVLVYALSHVIGFLAIIAVAKIFAATGSRWGTLLVSEHNVGASAGAVGAMGAWLMAFPRPLRTWSIALCAAFLVAAFGGDVHPWDIAHLASFLAGLGLGSIFARGRRRAQTEPKFNAHPGTQTDRRVALAGAGAIVGVFCVLAPFALVDGMTIPELFRRVTPHALDLMRWLFFATGVILMATAPLVRRGHKGARMIALVSAAVCCVTLWQPGAPGVEHVLAIMLVVGLLVWRDDFAAPAAGAPRHALAALAIPLCALVFVLFGFVALRDHFVPPLGLRGSLHMAHLRLRFSTPPLPNWHSPGALWFLKALPFITYGSVLLAIPMFFRSGKPGKPRIAAGSSGRSGQPE
jgi:hypothetical protein